MGENIELNNEKRMMEKDQIMAVPPMNIFGVPDYRSGKRTLRVSSIISEATTVDTTDLELYHENRELYDEKRRRKRREKDQIITPVNTFQTGRALRISSIISEATTVDTTD